MAGFGTGNLAGNDSDMFGLVTPDSPVQASSTVLSCDISALRGKTIWMHFFATDVIPLITEIWFE